MEDSKGEFGVTEAGATQLSALLDDPVQAAA
jgi:hypothetical protein